MGFGAAIKSAFVNWRDFRGRALRSEYWYFTLFYVLCSLPFDILKAVSGAGTRGVFELVGALVSLVIVVPHVAVFVRRLHDTDHSGWWLAGELGTFLVTALLLNLFPPLGAVLMVAAVLVFLLVLFWLVAKGTEGGNRFGPPRIPHPEPVEG
jgi:uncharacterized membrane protein YhaH (DUF805 family)